MYTDMKILSPIHTCTVNISLIHTYIHSYIHTHTYTHHAYPNQVAAGKKPTIEQDIAELKKFRSWYKGSLLAKVPAPKPPATGPGPGPSGGGNPNLNKSKNNSIASAGQLKLGGPLKIRTEFLLARIEEVKLCCSRVHTYYYIVHTYINTYTCCPVDTST